MSQNTRHELIGRSLGIKPINHGQIYSFQIAIPDSRRQALSLEQRQAIEKSLLAHQSNLISLIIRRTDAYDNEDIEYELVYGADWLQIAQELDIEKVWAWVFDMTDEQAITAIAEMESLTQASKDTQPSTKKTDGIDSDIAALIDNKLQLATDSIKNSITSVLNGIRNDLDDKLKVLNYRIDNFNSTGSSLDELKTILEKLDTIQQQLSSSSKRSRIEPIENQINLLEASEQDIENALRQVRTSGDHIRVAIAAVQRWKQSEQGLTWRNLELSAKSSRTSSYKIDGFGQGIYKRLQAVSYIPEK